MTSFTPFTATLGGLLIGLAAAILWLGAGRIAGISGMFGQLLPPRDDTSGWRLAFIVALVLGALLAGWALPSLGSSSLALVGAPQGWGIPTPVWIAIAGLLTGLGTRLANGCTSGHGVCGIARLSPRSFVAVGTFFGVAMLTVAVTGIV
ncbi:YeeE/YedE family protein [Devosia sp.]|uniref:YeeE/YedE family protein n=1 Tax=Devosia sp. TaxID=1871048 RepID=UPI003A8E69CE